MGLTHLNQPKEYEKAEGSKTRNMSVEWFANVCSRYMFEIHKSGSANLGSAVPQKDRSNFQKYVKDLEAKLVQMKAHNDVHLPQSVNREAITLTPPQVDEESMENDNLKLCLRQLRACWTEMVDSESSNMSSGILKDDEETIKGALNFASKFMSDYLSDESLQPVTLPKSTPRDDNTGPGRPGIN